MRRRGREGEELLLSLALRTKLHPTKSIQGDSERSGGVWWALGRTEGERKGGGRRLKDERREKEKSESGFSHLLACVYCVFACDHVV